MDLIKAYIKRYPMKLKRKYAIKSDMFDPIEKAIIEDPISKAIQEMMREVARKMDEQIMRDLNRTAEYVWNREDQQLIEEVERAGIHNYFRIGGRLAHD